MLRDAIAWVNRRGSLSMLVRSLRETLPGDPDFGDPMSTTAPEPAQVLARRAWGATSGRFSTLAELGLAALQLADWLGPDTRRVGGDGDMAIFFTDLVGFSTWAVHAGDDDSLELLRRVDAQVTESVTEEGGLVVKRLGDGTMAVFDDADAALRAAVSALRRAPEGGVDGYEPQLRAGLHLGTPQPIGNDFIGVDVTIAARLCEAAEPGELLMSGVIVDDLGENAGHARPLGRRPLPGVPPELSLHGLTARH